MITIHRVLFWLSCLGKVDFSGDFGPFRDVATAFSTSAAPARH